MKYPPLDDREEDRLNCLQSLDVLDTTPDLRLDEITHSVAERFQAPIVLVSLVDERRQWFKSKHGLDAAQTPRAYSFCGHAIYSEDRVFVVPDALRDRDFADNPLVVGPPHVRSYAGAPIISPGGHAIGTLCVIDTEPRSFDPGRLEELTRWARACADILFGEPASDEDAE